MPASKDDDKKPDRPASDVETPEGPTEHERAEARRVTGNLPEGDPRRERVERATAQGNMATLGGTQGNERPDDSDTTSLGELQGAGGVASPPGKEKDRPENIGPMKVVSVDPDEPEMETVSKMDFTPVTMDVEPDFPGLHHRTVVIQGVAVKVAAGKGVTIPATAAEILGNAAQDHRTEQIRQGGVPPVLDLTEQPT